MRRIVSMQKELPRVIRPRWMEEWLRGNSSEERYPPDQLRAYIRDMETLIEEQCPLIFEPSKQVIDLRDERDRFREALNQIVEFESSHGGWRSDIPRFSMAKIARDALGSPRVKVKQ
jgi:hypothetical protein